MSDCTEPADVQYVWVDPSNGRFHISPPLCQLHSEEWQPAETVTVLPLEFADLECEGSFDPYADESAAR